MKKKREKVKKNHKKRYLYKLVGYSDNRSMSLPSNDKYSLKYYDGTIIEALPNTLGIFLFKRLKDAVKYKNEMSNHNNNLELKIKRVIPLGKVSRMRLRLKQYYGLSNEYKSAFMWFGKIRNNRAVWIRALRRKLSGMTISTPVGTYTCSKVRVIGDIDVK